MLNVCFGEDAFRALFPCPMRFAALVVFLGCGMCFAGFTGMMLSSRCVPFGCRPAQDARHHGRYKPEGPLRGEMPFFVVGSGTCKAGIAGCIRLAMCSLLFSAGPDALHHGRYEPESLLRGGRAHCRLRQRHAHGWFCG